MNSKKDGRSNHEREVRKLTEGRGSCGRLKGIVTDVFGLGEVQKAMDCCVNNKADIVKAVIHFAK